jgi:hypothetical protein
VVVEISIRPAVHQNETHDAGCKSHAGSQDRIRPPCIGSRGRHIRRMCEGPGRDGRGFPVIEEGSAAQVEKRMRVLRSSTVLRCVVGREALATDVESGAKPPGLVGWSLTLLRTSLGVTLENDPPDAKAFHLLRRAASTLQPQARYVGASPARSPRSRSSGRRRPRSADRRGRSAHRPPSAPSQASSNPSVKRGRAGALTQSPGRR